ncbi:sensor histidine kinase [Nocardia sp. XZ_19_385]|uniref:sensor histidine kinase n=1 Tax=Nocardia sp. XZ_19_385 TaxID=2769488 RepID=UPI00188E7E3D|nr:histidine kinase [Nocardia sp. XZ_19_385]
MDVTQTIPSPGSARSAIPLRDIGSIQDRWLDFWRNPRAVFRRYLEGLPFDYPPALMTGSWIAMCIIGTIATIQRHSYFPNVLPLVAVLLMLTSMPVFCIFRITPPPLALAASGVAGTAVFLMQPVQSDFAPFVLIVVVGEVAAIVPKRWSVLYALVALAELSAFDSVGRVMWSGSGNRLEGLQMYTAGLALGWMVGVMLRYQRKFLYQEREGQQIRAMQAADEERRRIAREVHDVIAHSLSITLLHLTGARHALETDRDVDDAVAALVDAERLGRQAMADIRRTIGLLDGRPSKPMPEPGIGDIDSLVGDFVRAGLDIRYTGIGDQAAVSAAVGLALYRIGQESLANVVKHAPGATATVQVVVDAHTVTLMVDNTLPAGLPSKPGNGMGLSGMRQRAELLGGVITAGPGADGWSVRAAFPLAAQRNCVLPELVQLAVTTMRDGVSREEPRGAKAWPTVEESA